MKSKKYLATTVASSFVISMILSGSVSAKKLTWEQNTLFTDAEYGNTVSYTEEMGAAGAAACMGRCYQDEKCTGFSYNKDEIRKSPFQKEPHYGACRLIYNFPQKRQQSDCCTSGVDTDIQPSAVRRVRAKPMIAPVNFPKCEIKLGGSGKDSPVFSTTSDKSFKGVDIGGPWNFIRWTKGQCTFYFTLVKRFSKAGSKGEPKTVAYGSNINKKVALGAKGGSVDAQTNLVIREFVIKFAKNAQCSITLGDEGVRQTFFGPTSSLISEVTAWNFVTETNGPCEFRVFNKADRTGNSRSYHSGIRETLRVGWRIRAVEIRSSD